MSSQKNLSLFVDLGGTKTTLELVDSSPKILRTQTVPTDLHFLEQQISKFYSSSMASLKSIQIGLRGVWTDKEKAKWTKQLQKLSNKVQVVSDIELTHKRIFGDKPGILLIAGTGSICFGRKGHRWSRAGGLGPLFGDEGSGFWIGREYLRGKLATNNDWISMRRIVTAKDPVRTIASYAPRVLKRAEKKKDGIESSIAETAALYLAHLVRTVQGELGDKKIPLCLHGGIFKNQFFKKLFLRKASL